MSGMLCMLRIEVDGHHHGGPPLKPWVAEIGGPDPKYGLARTFIRPMNDLRDAHRAWSGNLYGMVATFALREGHLYEVARARGKPSHRYLAREFCLVNGGKRQRRTAEEALAHVDGGGDALVFRVRDVSNSHIAAIERLGMPRPLPWVVVDGDRIYRLRDGLYEIVTDGSRSLAGVRDGQIHPLTDAEALEWLRVS